MIDHVLRPFGSNIGLRTRGAAFTALANSYPPVSVDLDKIENRSTNMKTPSLITILCAVYELLSASAVACETPTEQFCVDYYRGITLAGRPVLTTTTQTINYDWKKGSPNRRISSDFFSARWQGRFQFGEGTYQFSIAADNGARILLDGETILDRWTGAQDQEYTTVMNPGAGSHLVTVEYYESTGSARINAAWHPIVQLSANGQSNTNKVAAASTATTPPKKPSFPLGINLSAFNYWSSAAPFKNLIMQNGAVGVYKRLSEELCEIQPPRDNDGYPTYIPKGCRFKLWSVFHIKNEYWPAGVPPYRPGRYVLLYKGVGNIKLGWDASNVKAIGNGRMEFDVSNPNNGIQIEVLESNKNNPIRDLQLIHADDEATFRTQPFNEAWLNILKPFSVIRFMDWGQVSLNITKYDGRAVAHTRNTITLPSGAPDTQGYFDGMAAMVSIDGKYPRVFIDRYDGASRTLYLRSPIEQSTRAQPSVTIFDFANKSWAQRTRPTTLGQTGDAGVAFEYMIDLANTLNAHPWINVPTAANDGFVEALALLIKSRLKPSLKVYVEYSNETWNYGWPGYHYSEAKANDLKLTGTWIPADAWHAYRAVEIFKIFNRVFGEPDLRQQRRNSRLIRVLTSQTAWFDRAVKVMDWTASSNAWPTQGTPAHKFADAWAITTYFAAPKDAKPVDRASQTELINMQIADIDQASAKTPSPGIYRQYINAARARGLQLVAYEGGTHLLAPQERTDLVSKLVLANRDAEMSRVYSHALSKWNEFATEYGPATIGVWNQYYDVGRYSKYGYWGLLESTYQSKTSAPKYKALEAPALK